MNLEKYRAQHEAIYDGIHGLRELTRGGIAENAEGIVKQIVKMSAVIKLHLSTEDRFLYTALQQVSNQSLARLGRTYQDEMMHIAEAYGAFSSKWLSVDQVTRDPEAFRSDANRVLKTLFERMKREERDFYPAVEMA